MRDIRHLDLNLLKALDALLDERNVTRAAARLGVTQPAMSGMLTRLRDTFDDSLFVRTQRGITPTQRALDLAKPLKQVMTEVNALLHPPGFDPESADLTLTIAATDYAQSAIAVPVISALKARAPYIRVALVPVEGGDLQTRLERGDIDLALVTPEMAPPDLHARRLFDEHYVCVMRSEHPATRSKLTLNRFCALDHALVSYYGGSFSGVTDEALAKCGKRRRVSLSVKSFLVLPNILRASDLVAVAPARLVINQPGLTLLEPPLKIPGFTKIAVWHERSHRDPAQHWLRELLFETCRDDKSAPPRR
ncbi:LysR family transcriptional regulator [Burkholderia cepacia]